MYKTPLSIFAVFLAGYFLLSRKMNRETTHPRETR